MFRSICLLLVFAATVFAMEADFPRHPDLSPDGSLVAFDWRGDLWIVPSEGGSAERLSAHDAHDAYPCWSPDGRQLAFVSRRHGNEDIFVMDLATREPRRLTYHSGSDEISGWSADGKKLLFSSNRRNRWSHLMEISAEGGRPGEVIADEAFHAAVSPDGQWIAYVRGYTNWWRKNYRGWASRDLWIRAVNGGPSFHIVSWEGKDDHPHWSEDGKSLFFLSEREDAVVNLWRQELRFEEGSVAAWGEPYALSSLKGDGMQFLTLSADASLACYESEGTLWTLEVESGKTRRLNIQVAGDLKRNEQRWSKKGSGATGFALSPEETEIAFIVEGELYVAELEDGEILEPIRISETDAREKDPLWLDNESLVFVSDRNGNDDLFLVESAEEGEKSLGKARHRKLKALSDSPENERKPQLSPDGEKILYRRDTGFLWTMNPDGSGEELLNDRSGVLHSSWSPDSRFVAYSVTTLGADEDIFVLERDSGKRWNVSSHPNDDFHPLWSSDGKRLSWASRSRDGVYHIKHLWLTREEAEKSEKEREREKKALEDLEETPDVLVDFDEEDYQQRTVTVATTRGWYWDYDLSPDGEKYALRIEGVEGADLWAIDWDGDNLRRLSSGGSSPAHILWGEDSETLRYLSGGRIQELDSEGGKPKPLSFSVEFSLNERMRRLQKFGEAWRLLDDGFYDENFHGRNWPEIRKRYEPMAAAAVMTEDFNDVLRKMIGELNASHLGAWGGPRSGEGRDRSGELGFLPDDSWKGPGILVDRIIPHGPLDREGSRIEEGEVILSIDGRDIGEEGSHWEYLNRTSGKEIDLRVSSRPLALRKSRIVTVTPVSTWKMRSLMHEDWVKRNRAFVDKHSGGRLAYVYMSAMGDGNWNRFIEDIYSKARGKEGLILDIRFNNGGHIHDQVLTFLSRKAYGYSRGRDDTEPTFDAMRRWDGPIVLLINERSYSDGEIFPMGFKALELGTVIGMPTFGAVIGTHNVPLIDGTSFRVPGTGWYRLSGENLENGPVHPDIYVPAVPEEARKNRDAQLEAGIGECLKLLETH
ncbi:MAG: S41 family peptidase [Candidatus Krumholzibacteria bacterium]|jgi:tricorn protease|nr:S41 family peptidase [Candidatus Krumholzibacteria bacterium]MDP6668556.1 S41 family peptidase [Candidatus Krumholzibacteria bacterium]MDP6796885.1 S41 family peptidase [Candidatus Krumholzibacteria bacterium]MDP7021808.1 S41 family peptidase [Candidatus Krumholzibacteria bacterium]